MSSALCEQVYILVTWIVIKELVKSTVDVTSRERNAGQQVNLLAYYRTIIFCLFSCLTYCDSVGVLREVINTKAVIDLYVAFGIFLFLGGV